MRAISWTLVVLGLLAIGGGLSMVYYSTSGMQEQAGAVWLGIGGLLMLIASPGIVR